MRFGIYDVYNGVKVPNQTIYEDILNLNDVNYTLLNIKDIDFWEKLVNIDLLMYKWPNNDDQHLLSNILRPLFESLKINFFPNSATSWHYDDKIKQYYFMLLHGADPVPSHIFFHKDAAFEYISKADYPIVAKLKKGASSANVRLIRNKIEARQFITKAFSKNGISPDFLGSPLHVFKTLDNNIKSIIIYYLKKFKRYYKHRDFAYWERHKNYVLFQDFLPGNAYDTRVTTVGSRVHAFRRFVRKNDFRASGGEEWDINPEKIDKKMLRIALDFSQKMNFQTMAYDFIYDKEKNPKIIEISNLYGQPGFPDFMNGYWDFELNWISGRYWPQYFELIDALNMPSLKCPDIQIPSEWLKNKII